MQKNRIKLGILEFFRFIKLIIMRIINIFKVYKIVFSDTYYPEIDRKNVLIRFFDNILWVLKFGELNEFYNLYGLDVNLERKNDDYLNYQQFMQERNKMNGLDNNYSYVCLLRDKYLFEKYLKSNDINVVSNIAIIKDGKIYDHKLQLMKEKRNIFNDVVFIKSVDGECANGVFCIHDYDEYVEKKKFFENGMFIIQEKIMQHEKMSAINAKSVNTIRIVTTKVGDDISVFSAGLRVGTSKSGNVDNWAVGGLYIEIDENGKLTKYGFAKPMYGGRVQYHPDSKIKFNGYQIPKYDDVVKLVINAHKLLYNIHSIGWDVAITPEGPILIEGNDNWEISLMQVNSGLKDKWNERKI